MERCVMRASLSVLFALLIVSLLICAVLALRSKKPVGRNIANLLVALAIPVLGNLILIASSDDIIANVGCYIYFLGMDASVCSIFYFTHSYCEMGRPKRPLLIMIYSLFGIDLLHYALNPYIGLSFATEKIIVEGRAYYRLVPYIGQAYHRVVCYSLFIASIIIFVVVTSKASKVYVEKYSVILFSMVITGAIESYYIFSGQPMDMSMIGFAVFGLLVYFFCLQRITVTLLSRQEIMRLWHLRAFELWDVQNHQRPPARITCFGFFCDSLFLPSGTWPFAAPASCIV